jgi:glycosyltransferase involved in cell wall biosynthesis
VLAGDGDARAEFEQLARQLGVAEMVTFLGWRRDIPAVLAALDVVALPTVMDFEGVPVSVIEALAVGRPVVASAVGGVADAVIHGRTGWLVPPRDPVALAAALTEALNDRQRARAVGMAGRERATGLFGLERFIAETEQYLDEVTRR